MAAALGGLLGLSGCGSDGSPSDGPSDIVHDDNPHITLSRVEEGLTMAEFSEDCDAVEGKLEVHPHCNGFNSCKGFSYDSDKSVYTEHTCMGVNTCTGFSCVVGDD